jgi:hypothetical protein
MGFSNGVPLVGSIEWFVSGVSWHRRCNLDCPSRYYESSIFVFPQHLFFAAAATTLPLSLFPLTGGGSMVLLVTGHSFSWRGSLRLRSYFC